MIERALFKIAYVVTGLVSLALLSLGQATAAPQFPALSGRVVDEAGVLSASTQEELTRILAGDEEHYGGRQVVVVTLKSLQGVTIEDYGYQLGRHWAVGQKGKNNGTLLIVAPKEHKARIEVGYGLEGTLTDAMSRVIIDRTMLPAFRKGDYDGGVIAGTKALLGALGNTSYAAPSMDETGGDDSGAPSNPLIGLIIFALIFFFFGRSFFWPLFFLGGFGGGRRGGGWGGGGGGGFGGGGFGGGGGSFGGGGASGSW